MSGPLQTLLDAASAFLLAPLARRESALRDAVEDVKRHATEPCHGCEEVGSVTLSLAVDCAACGDAFAITGDGSSGDAG